mgnify:CR=1 FL=1
MARLPDPTDSGFIDVVFYANIGSAVRFELDQNPNLGVGDSFYFRTSGSYPTYNGDYVVAGTAFDGVVYKLTTTCIGTEDVIGS